MRNTSVLATIALAAIIAIPGASYAGYAIQHKPATPVRSDPTNCTGSGCATQNPAHATQPCSSSNCSTRTRKHKSLSSTSKSDTSK
jgi:hypothetical protein